MQSGVPTHNDLESYSHLFICVSKFVASVRLTIQYPFSCMRILYIHNQLILKHMVLFSYREALPNAAIFYTFFVYKYIHNTRIIHACTCDLLVIIYTQKPSGPLPFMCECARARLGVYSESIALMLT